MGICRNAWELPGIDVVRQAEGEEGRRC